MNRRGIPLLTAGAVFLAALAVYTATLAPTITWSHDAADSGELVTAVYTGGIPHPPGYPTYLLLAAPFAHLSGWEPARGVNLFSALCAALAAGLVTLAGWHLLGASPLPAPLRAIIAGTAGLSFAFAPTPWSQAVVAEVYALHSAFAALLLLLMTRELAGESGRYIPAAALALGLGLGNHLSLALMAPALALTTVISWRNSRRPLRQLLAAGGLFLLGLLVYLILPIRAAADPPVNWGDPRTPERFWWLVSGQLYQRFLFRLPLDALPGRLSAWAALLRQQFGLVGVGLALAGIWFGGRPRRTWNLLAGLTYVLFVAYAMGYDTSDSYVYLIPSYAVVSLWITQGLAGILETCWTVEGFRQRWPLAAGVLLILPLTSAVIHWREVDLRQDRLALAYAEEALAGAEEEAIILAHGDAPTFALWYAHYALGRRPDVTLISIALWQYDWYRATMARLDPSLSSPDGGPPSTIEALMQSFRTRRPIYLAGESTLLSQYPWTLEGLLYYLEE
jgi:hypothetical protein